MYFRLASAEDHQINDLWIYAQNANHGHKRLLRTLPPNRNSKRQLLSDQLRNIDISHGGSVDNGAWIYASYRIIQSALKRDGLSVVYRNIAAI